MRHIGKRSNTAFLAMLRSGLAYSMIPLVGLVSAPLMAQALGPTGRGELAAILQPLTVAGAFASFGLPAAVTYFVGSGSDRRQVTRKAVQFSILALLVVCAALVFYAPQIARVSHQPLWFVGLIWLSIIPGALVAIRRSILQADGRYGALDGERATSGLLRLGFVVILFFGGVTISGPFTAAYTVAGLLAMIWLLSDSKGPATSNADPLTGAVFARYAFMSSVGVIATTLNSRLDQAILPAAMSAKELGIYSVAVTVAELPYVVTAVMMRNLLSETSRGARARELWTTFAIGQGVVTVGCLVLIALSPWIIPTFFGASFASAILVTGLLLVATIFGSIAQSVSATLAGLGSPGWSSIAPLCGAFVTALGLIAFWSSMSASMAAWISLASQIVVCVLAVTTLILRRGHGALRRNGAVR